MSMIVRIVMSFSKYPNIVIILVFRSSAIGSGLIVPSTAIFSPLPEIQLRPSAWISHLLIAPLSKLSLFIKRVLCKNYNQMSLTYSILIPFTSYR